MTEERHNCVFVRGESWRPPERVGAEIHRIKIRGKTCICGRFEPSARRPLAIRRQRSGIETLPAGGILFKLSSDENHAARELLKLLLQDGGRERRWESIARRLVSRGLTLPRLEQIVDILCRAGIVRVGETNTGSIHAAWRLSQIILEPAALMSVCDCTGVVPEHLRRESLLEAIEPALCVPAPGGQNEAAARRVHQLLRENVDAMRAGAASALLDLSGNVIATPSRWSFFESILRALAGLAHHLAEGTPAAAESFSARVYGISKEFTSARREALTQLVGVGLAELGLVERDSELLVFGPVRCSVNSYAADGRATGSWLGLPGAVLQGGTLNFETDRMVVVENLTPFELFAKSCAKAGEWPFLGLFGGGYLSSTGTALVSKAIETGVRNIAVWADMDADGILLAQDLIDLVNSSGALATAVAMDCDTFRGASRSYAIEPSRLRLLSEHLPRLTYPLADLAGEILSSGRGVEQEVVLSEGLESVSSWARLAAGHDIPAGVSRVRQFGS